MVVEEPGYVSLYRSGELGRRADILEARLRSCDICPRECRVNRLEGEVGFCRSRRLPIVAAVCAHRGEEPAISGTRGSGAVFFGNCNLRCVYCQNHQISQSHQTREKNAVQTFRLAGHMLYLQDVPGCHNINLVTPSHFVPQIVRALPEAVSGGLRLPLVYNTSSYDSVETLKALEGIVDIYLADLRYASNENAARFSGAADYVARASVAIREMYRQVGDLVVDGQGIARRGLIVRHLILPGRLAGSRESLAWLVGEISPSVTVSIMAQYNPSHRAGQVPGLGRAINRQEYAEVMELLEELDIGNGWVQELDASDHYMPDFDREGHPFEPAIGKAE